MAWRSDLLHALARRSLDGPSSTRQTCGVAAALLRRRHWRRLREAVEAEASVFNGREPDENRANFDFGALDSISGRVWFLPTKQWALQVSAGRLTEAEAGHDGGPRIDGTRVTASATFHRAFRPGSIWANTIGWGCNQEPGKDATNALLAETNVPFDERDTWFGRFELSGKSGHDLAIESAELFTIAKLLAGYTRYLSDWRCLKPGVGAQVSAGIVPESLKPFYGSRFNPGFGVFLTIRPGSSGM
jgi:hypothetical protein